MISDDAFKKLLDFFNRPWGGYRKVRKGVKKRIRRHMQETGCPDMDCYLAALAGNPEVRAACEQHLAVTISRFFRDRRLWDHLGDRVLPELVRRFGQDLRAWSAGCSNAEEPCSLAITWDRVRAAQAVKTGARLSILATDIRPDSIERARQGHYNAASLKEVPEDIKKNYFTAVKGGRHYHIHRRIIESVCLRLHDLQRDPAPGRFHLIFLRNNLLTYYRNPDFSVAFQRVLDSLYPGGALVVGAHEKPPADAPLVRDQWAPWIFYKIDPAESAGSRS